MPNDVQNPFTVLVDTREQLPYAFDGLKEDAADGGGRLIVNTRRECLPAGDYSIEGYSRMVTVERKSLVDLWATFTSGRARFLRELKRLREYDFAAVVCEAELSEILSKQNPWANIRPRTITRSVMFWQLRYPQIRWWACPGRAIAEAVTFQLLRTWWRERIDAPARAQRKLAAQARREAKKTAGGGSYPGGGQPGG